MRKIFLLVTALISWSAWAQQPEYLNLDEIQTGLHDNKAIQEVKLSPGYEYESYTVGEQMDAHIDLSLIGSVQEGNLLTEEEFNEPINLDAPVLNLSGNLSVSASGGATYSLPIDVPMGTNGMEPQLSVNYNSQGGNGILGMGWSLSGVSSITRVPKNHFNDGEMRAVQYDETDVFALDGQRLFVTNGLPYAGHGTEYGTELETYSEITSYHNSNGDVFFRVVTKDGTILEYGTDDSRQVSFSKTIVSGVIPEYTWHTFKWSINQIRDTYGNYIEFDYIQEDGQFRLDKILYTGNQFLNLEPSNTIQFHYKERLDELKYLNTNSNILLDRIRFEVQGNFSKEYQFNHGFDLVSYLNEIKVIGMDGSETNPVKFLYETDEFDVELVDVGFPDLGLLEEAIYQDFNNDGLVDYVMFEIDVLQGKRYISKWNLFYNNGNGTFDPIATGNIPQNYAYLYVPEYTTYFYYVIPGQGNIFDVTVNTGASAVFYPKGHGKTAADFNGDGIADFAVVNYHYNGSKFVFEGFMTFIWNSDLNTFEFTDYSNPIGQEEYVDVDMVGGNPVPDSFIWFEDFDGDEKTDVLTFSHKWSDGSFNPVLKYYDVDTESVKVMEDVGWPVVSDIDGSNMFNLHKAHAVDHDGDGIASLHTAHFSVPGVNYMIIVPSEGDELIIENEYVGGGWTNERTISGDFNGDGFDEVIAFDNLEGKRSTADINSDGKIDIIEVISVEGYPTGEFTVSEGGGYLLGYDELGNEILYWEDGYVFHDVINLEVNILLKLKNGSEYEEYETNSIVAHSLIRDRESANDYYVTVPYFVPDRYGNIESFLDANNDGKLEVKLEGFPKPISLLHGGNVMSATVNSFGVMSEIKYNRTDNQDTYVLNEEIDGYPIYNYRPTGLLVSEIISENPTGGDNITEYKYENARKHVLGRGFLGFEKNYVQTYSTGGQNSMAQLTVTDNTIDPDFIFPTVYQIKTYKISEPQQAPFAVNELDLLEHRLNSETTTTSLGGRFKYEVNEVITNSYFDGYVISENVANYDYDSYGNVINQWTSLNGSLLNTHVHNTYLPFGGNGIPNKVVTSTLTTHRLGEPEIAKSRFYDYTVGGNLKKEIEGYNTTKTVTKEFEEFGQLGLPTKLTVSTSDGYANNSELQYDETGRYVIESMNTLNQSTSYEYHPIFGKPTSITDISGHTTQYEYDEFGNLISTIMPNGDEANVSFEFVSSEPSYQNQDYFDVTDALYKVTSTSTMGDQSTSYYNKFGQNIRTVSDAYNGEISVVNSYNNLGQLVSVTDPFLGEEFEGYSTTEYDNYGRVVSRKYFPPNGLQELTNSVDYGWDEVLSNWVVTSTSPDGTTTQRFSDASGVNVKVIDHTGANISYEYYSDGNLKNTYVDDLEVAHIEYDQWGNQVLLRDPNSGENHYSYNALGQLEWQMDGNGHEFDMLYDDIGRLIQRIGPDGNYDYDYVTNGNGLNEVKKITAPNGFFTEYQYGEYNTVTSVTENIDGIDFVTSYEYDDHLRVISEQRPDGFSIVNSYDNRGFLDGIYTQDMQTAIWQPIDQNAKGQYEKFSLGNGFITELQFDNYGLPTNIISKNADNLHIQDLEMGWDHYSGNLNWRIDHNKQLFESFSYEQHRLKTYEVEGLPQYEISYLDNGNINSKPDAGDYVYNANSKPNAVVQIENPSPVQAMTVYNLDHTDFNSVNMIAQSNLLLELGYGADQQRRIQTVTNAGQIVSTRYYVGAYEKIVEDNTTREINYITSPSGTVAVNVKENGNSELYYLYQDHLGSIVTITDDVGMVVHEQNFDPWGRYRDPNTWEYLNTADDVDFDQDGDGFLDWINEISSAQWSWFNRGYTGHEMLPAFGLINMNGRVYDPILGQMTQVDNFVQNPGNSQSFNRYCYVMNNPLKYTDPSGEVFEFATIANRFYTTLLSTAAFSGVGYVAGGYIGNGGEFDHDDARKGLLLGGAVGLGLGIAAPNFIKHLSPWYHARKFEDGCYASEFHIDNWRSKRGRIKGGELITERVVERDFSNRNTRVYPSTIEGIATPNDPPIEFRGFFGDMFTRGGRGVSSLRGFYNRYQNELEAEFSFRFISAKVDDFSDHHVIGPNTTTSYEFNVPIKSSFTLVDTEKQFEPSSNAYQSMTASDVNEGVVISITKDIGNMYNPPVGDACYSYDCSYKVRVKYSIKRY